MAPKTIARASTYDQDVVRALGVFGWVIMTIINPEYAHAYAVGEYVQIQGHRKSMVNWKYGKIVKSEQCAPNRYRIVVAKVEPRPIAEWNPVFPAGIERAKRGCSIIFEIPSAEVSGPGSAHEEYKVYTLPTDRHFKPDVVPRRVPVPTAEAVAYVTANEAGVLPMVAPVAQPEIQPAPVLVPAAIQPAPVAPPDIRPAPVAQPEIQPAPVVVPAEIQPEPETPAETPRGRAPLVDRRTDENRGMSFSPIGRMIAAPFKYGHRAYATACANSKLRTLRVTVQKNGIADEAINDEIARNNQEYDEEEARVHESLRKLNAMRARKNANLTRSREANSAETVELLKEIAQTESELAQIEAA